MNISEFKKYEPRGMHRQLPVIWQTAKDCTVTDVKGKKYIDFTSGIFVTNAGHGAISDTLIRQAQKLIHCYTFPNIERLELAQKLTKMTGYQKAFFMSAGTEATECAVKIMRLDGKKKKREFIVSFRGAMHGKTFLAEALKGNEYLSFVKHLTFPTEISDFKTDIKELFDSPETKIAGFIIESYRGWDAKFYPKKYIQDLVAWAKKNRIPVCFDDIQGGFFRSGKLFAFQHYEVEPDLVCCGKGLGDGLPISAVLGSAKLMDLPEDLSSTHSGNPLCCAVALANLEQLVNHKLFINSQMKGLILHDELQDLKTKYPFIKEINGRGLLAGIVFDCKKTADKIIYRAMKKGLLMVYTGRESIKIGPPLSISASILEQGLQIIGESFK